MRMMMRRKYNAVMGMITPGDDDMMANINMAKSYPYLSQALGGEDGFDPTNPSVKRSMCGLMTEFNKLLHTEYQLDVNGISNNKISYDRVPLIQSDRSFLDSKEWVNTAIHIAGRGTQHRRQFCTMQDPLVRALAREKATSRNTHPDVLAQVDATDTGNKRKLPEKKADVISTRRKLQQDVGRFQAIKYFIDTKEETLPLAEVLFRNGEVDSDSQNAACMEYSCHLEKELTSTN